MYDNIWQVKNTQVLLWCYGEHWHSSCWNCYHSAETFKGFAQTGKNSSLWIINYWKRWGTHLLRPSSDSTWGSSGTILRRGTLWSTFLIATYRYPLRIGYHLRPKLKGWQKNKKVEPLVLTAQWAMERNSTRVILLKERGVQPKPIWRLLLLFWPKRTGKYFLVWCRFVGLLSGLEFSPCHGSRVLTVGALNVKEPHGV